ncbi:hypothetical protein EDD85DRAFT_794581 [Armillaria nabsnona]|nr:hypothetical protein EDD85DRAFT_794581 [Armillaria nabsnona]
MTESKCQEREATRCSRTSLSIKTDPYRYAFGTYLQNSFPKNGGIFYPELDDYTKEFLRVKKQEIGRDRIKDLELFPKNLLNLIENSTLEGLKHRGIDIHLLPLPRPVAHVNTRREMDAWIAVQLDRRLWANPWSLSRRGRLDRSPTPSLSEGHGPHNPSSKANVEGIGRFSAKRFGDFKKQQPNREKEVLNLVGESCFPDIRSSTNYSQGASHIGNAPVRLEEKPDSIVSMGFSKLTSKEQPLLKFYRNDTSPYLLTQKVCAFY